MGRMTVGAKLGILGRAFWAIEALPEGTKRQRGLCEGRRTNPRVERHGEGFAVVYDILCPDGPRPVSLWLTPSRFCSAHEALERALGTDLSWYLTGTGNAFSP